MKHPLTASQLALYYESVNKSGLPVYVVPPLYTLEPGVDLKRLKEAVDRVIARYPVLSMVISTDEEGMPCLTEDEAGGNVRCRIEEIGEEEFEARLKEFPQPFDLEGGKLMGVRIFKTPKGTYMYLPMHHIISDGSTYNILIERFRSEYNGEEVEAPALTIFDVQAREAANAESPRHEEAKAWYAETFGGIESDSMPLPDRLEVEPEDGKSILSTTRLRVKNLDVEYDKVFALSRQLKVPLSVVFDSVFGYMAGIWNANDESSFCTIFAGRKREEEKGVVGMLVKTVPVYCNWDGDTTVSEYITGISEQHKRAKEYADTYSFAELCADTGFSSRLNFSYRGSITTENRVLEGLIQNSRRLGYYTTGDTLLFMVDHVKDGLTIKAEFQGKEYTDEYIDSMLDAYEMVLRGFLEEEQLRDIELCSPEMIARLEAYNETVAERGEEETIVDIFRRHVEATPDKAVGLTEDGEISYREADKIARKTAGYIESRGIGRGEAVAVMVGRNRWMLPVTLGVLSSGAAYQPLDPSYPAERLNYMMRDAGVALLIQDRDIELELEEDLHDKVKILYTDEIEVLAEPEKESEKPRPGDTFILLYTSGTTGLPKGVRLTHSNLMALACSHRQKVPGSAMPESRWAMYASYGFDAGFFSLLLPVIYGGSTAVVPDDIRLDMEALNRFFEDKGVNFAFMTTQVGRIFATTTEETPVRVLMSGGEKLVPCAPPAGFDFYNIYGPTEGTVYSHCKLLDRLYTRVPIGRTLDDYKNYIVDKYGRRMPLGALGEMLIAGPQVGAGYLNLPEKTAAVFVENPFSEEAAYSRCYRTGDVVRLLPANGEADIIGRNDGQVKVRGFRIELTEVEQIIREYPGIKDATVQAFDSPAGGKFIAAYIVADEKIDIEELHDFIADHKPPYMVPEATMQIEAIPLNRNQKVDKRALPAPELNEMPKGEVGRKVSLLEKIIAEIVKDVLKLEEVPITVELSRLGLTSISSIRLASALYKRLGISVKGADLVKGATVVSIEDMIIEDLLEGCKNRGKGDEANKEKGKKAERETGESKKGGTLLTVSQQGVYADTMRRPCSTSYNIPIYFRFGKKTDAEALAEAVRRILDAHPYLRDAHLQMGDYDVEQSVEPHMSAEVSVKKMTEEEFGEYKKDFIRPFDLMKAPLYRIEVITTEENVYLLMDVQHIVFDGSSLTVMINQLKTLLEGGEILAEEFTYPDYAEAEREWLDGEGGAKAAEFFREMLGDCEAASDIPSDRSSGEDAGSRGIITHAVDFVKVEKFCREHSLTPAALYLAATCYATARFTTAGGAYISTISSGRADVRFGETFGMFVKTLPIGMTIGEGTALEYTLGAKSLLTRVVENEMYPYSRICADYNYSPNIVYEYQYGLVDDIVISGEKVERGLLDVDTLKFKISVRIEEVEGKPSVAVHYRQGIYTDELMRTFCDSIATVAERIIENLAGAIKKLSMLTEAQEEIVEKFASTELSPHSDKCFHQLMEEQAMLHGDREAVVACDRRLTYAELDRLANIVANNLIAKGVKKGDKVVILLSRTSRFFTSLYGVLKAGAAYIPSSPDYPEERKRSIIEDSGAAFVITDENVEALHEGENDKKPEVEVRTDEPVYLIYTSGSTGKPKGVLLRHRGIVNYVTPAPTVIHTQAIVDRCTRVGSITTVAFDMALKEWGIALSNGLTVVFANDEQSNDPVALAELFSRERVDYFNTTPSRMQQYMELEEFCGMLGGCKVVICGAEKYPEHLVGPLRKIAPDAAIFNTYGPTEITVSSNACDFTHKSAVSVGHPLRNYIEYIVDRDDNVLPPGVIGELLIGGENIAIGYNANPEQTAKAFIEYKGRPTYRSGDYARFDGEGNVIILGRKDTQVKLRGLRIELGEIERVLGKIEGIAASHIMIRNVGGRENLVAYYVLKPGVTYTPEEIKEKISETLTDYMVPSFFVEMEKMPLTPNGKINARELPEPAIAEREAGREAENDAERFFVGVFKEILGTDTVYADDNFFSLGGTSLTATRIMIAASKAGHRIVYADIFANPTPAGLALLIEGTKRADGEVKEEPKKEAGTPEVGDDGYDYSAINRVLAGNTLQAFRDGEKRGLGTVLLTGATGYAGMHVLHELLENYEVEIVCLGRDSRAGVAAAERIEQLYFYYFGEPMSERHHERLKVVKGDITKIEADFDPGLKIDTVINCAANVKHFSAGTDIEDINYYGVLRLIEWCRAHGAALVQTSTVSVTGRQPAERDEVLTEQSLYIGQDFGGNKYITSKFEAERAVLEAHARGEIVGKVVRLGNLAPRERDGEFQVNFNTNGFMNRLKSITLVGCYPYNMYGQNKDISPIDDVAKAIVLFAQTPDACVVFHGNNANRYSLGNFYYEASKAGLEIRPVEAEVFSAALDKAKTDPKKLNALVGLMAYEGMGAGLKPVDYSNNYSNQVLLRMGYHWPVISSEYVYKLVRQLEGLGFFSELE